MKTAKKLQINLYFSTAIAFIKTNENAKNFILIS